MIEMWIGELHKYWKDAVKKQAKKMMKKMDCGKEDKGSWTP